MASEEFMVESYTSSVKAYKELYAKQNGVDKEGYEMEPVALLCDLLAINVECLTSMTTSIRSVVRETVSACLKLASSVSMDSEMSWMGNYTYKYNADRPSLVDDELLDQAASDAIDYVKASTTTHGDDDEIKKKCRLVVRFLKRAYRYSRPILARSEPQDHTSASHHMEALYKALDSHVETDSILESFLKAFHHTMIDEHLVPHKYYIRGIFFTQSSGYGKSRLMRNVGCYVPSFQIILEGLEDVVNLEKGKSKHCEVSVPRPDSEVCKFFKDHKELESGHHVATAFLAALFTQLYTYIAISYFGSTHMTLECYSPQIEEVYSTAMENKMMAKSLMAGVASKLDLQNGILDPLYELRSSRHNKDRSYFLSTVVDLAKAKLKCAGKDTIDTTGRDYIRLSGLEDSIADFFELIDGINKGSIKDVAGKSRQFIFGLDNCGHLDELLCAKENKGYPQGLASFARVFRDLDLLNASKGSSHPSRRVWLVMANTDVQSIVSIIPASESQSGLSYAGCTPASIWNTFGVDHERQRHILSNTKYPLDMSISQMHHLDHLKLIGRGIWSAQDRADLNLKLAVELIMKGADEWSSYTPVCVWKDRLPKPENWLDMVTFAIVSLRVGLGDNKIYDASHPAGRVVLEAIKKQMRTLVNYQADLNTVESTNIVEPIMAMAAIMILNYDLNVYGAPDDWHFDGYDSYYNNFATRNGANRTYFRLDSNSVFSATLFDIESDGALAGRLILTHTRDRTLPEKIRLCDGRPEFRIPHTTVKTFLEELIGKDQTEAILKMASNPALSQAVVNFIQFAPIKISNGETIEEDLLLKGFTRCCAYTFPPGSKLHTIIPIALPKVPSVDPTSITDDVNDGKLLSEYHYSYIGILHQANETPYIGPLQSYPIIGMDGVTVAGQAAAVIQMDMCVKGLVFKGQGRISNYVFAQMKETMLEIRILGLNKAYQGLAKVDPEGVFEAAVRAACKERAAAGKLAAITEADESAMEGVE